MTEGLLRAELRTVADVAELDTTEVAELFGELRGASVPLGDRSRLRKVAWGSVQGALRGGSTVDLFVPTDNACGKARAGLKTMPRADVRSDRRGGPCEQHRQLQSGGSGFSIEVAAIAFTGLVGMIGYAVQARSTQKASEARGGLEQEAAERDKAEEKAGKQLERVQLQMAEWVMPIILENQAVSFGWFNMAKVRQPPRVLTGACSVISLWIFRV
jgi:hypothetical protein